MDKPNEANEPEVAQPVPAPARRWRTLAERRADAAAANARRLETESAVRLQQAQVEVELRRLARVDAAETEVDALARHDRLEAHDEANQQKRREKIRTKLRSIRLAAVLSGANVSTQAVAVVGQILTMVYGLGWEWWQAAPVALVVESMAVNVGYYAHHRLLTGCSSTGLRALSYLIGALTGWFSYTHQSPEIAPFAAVFAGASFLGPMFWHLYGLWSQQAKLQEQGLLKPREAQAPGFGWRHWVFWAGETFWVYRRAIHDDVTDKQEAIKRYRPGYERMRARGRDQGKDAAFSLNDALQEWSQTRSERREDLPSAEACAAVQHEEVQGRLSGLFRRGPKRSEPFQIVPDHAGCDRTTADDAERARTAPDAPPAEQPVPQWPAPEPLAPDERAKAEFAAALDQRAATSERALAEVFGIGRRRAAEVVAEVVAERYQAYRSAGGPELSDEELVKHYGIAAGRAADVHVLINRTGAAADHAGAEPSHGGTAADQDGAGLGREQIAERMMARMSALEACLPSRERVEVVNGTKTKGA